MHVLTKDEIRFITETVDKAGITISHLHEDLVDHLCCEVEYEIENGLDFNQAFEKIKTVVGIKDLQRVQVNTLLLIDKNYRIMKTIMKVSGAVSTTLLTFGSLFKLMHWPWATAMLISGFVFMGFLFLPSAMYMMHRENKDVKMPLTYLFAFLGSFGFVMGSFFRIMHWPGTPILLVSGIGILCLLFLPTLLVFLLQKAESRQEKSIYTQGVISGIIYLLAILFKMMHWPGTGILLIVGSVALVLLFVFPYSFYKYKNEEHVKASFVYLIATATWFILFTMLLALNVQKQFLTGFDSSDEKIVENTKMFESKSENVYALYRDSIDYGFFLNVKKQSDELVQYIHDLKAEVIHTFYGQDEFDDSFITKSEVGLAQWHGAGKTNYFVPQKVMLGGMDRKGKASELKAKIEAYKMNLKGLVDKNTCELIETLLETNSPADAPESLQSWEMYCFKRTTIVGCINIFSGIQRDVRLAEWETLNNTINN